VYSKSSLNSHPGFIHPKIGEFLNSNDVEKYHATSLKHCNVEFRAVRILNAELRHKKITFACSFKNTKFYIIGLLVYIFGRYIQSYQMLFNLLPY
jgi:hypothetical protein